jgi:folate-binding Fe-S cluster repair protein YgfZ
VTYTSPLLGLSGAVPGYGADAAVAWHYGDPLREQRLLAQGLAVTDLSHRGVLRVTGGDRLEWLHSITAQRLRGLAPGTSAEALVVSSSGYIEHALHLVDDGDSTWITVEPETVHGLLTRLGGVRQPRQVTVSDATDEWAAVGLVVRPTGLDLADISPRVFDGVRPASWQDPWPAAVQGSISCTEVPDADHPGTNRPWQEVLLPRRHLADRLSGIPLAGSWAAEALRVEAWRPRLWAETDGHTFPCEADWLRTTVHVATESLPGNRVPGGYGSTRRLVMLHLDGGENAQPASRDAVDLDGRGVGQVTTAALHYELGPVALAMIAREVPVDAVLTVGGIAAAQEIIVRP